LGGERSKKTQPKGQKKEREGHRFFEQSIPGKRAQAKWLKPEGCTKHREREWEEGMVKLQTHGLMGGGKKNPKNETEQRGGGKKGKCGVAQGTLTE